MLGRALCVGLLTTLVGCGTGLIYTHVTTPLDLDFNNTPVVRAGARGDVKTLQFRVRFDWGSRGIGEIAKEYGFEEVYYADLETFSVLTVWTRQFVHVYGVQSDR